ncbi:MAG TPA: hypothetical protein VGG71_16400, partial [Chitinophagaceae bacterium]
MQQMISINPDLVLPPPKKLKRNYLFWLGIIIYSAAYTFSYTGILTDNVWNPIQAIGLLLCIPAAANLFRFKIDNAYLRFIFSLYCLWVIFICARGFSLNYKFLKLMLFDGWTGVFLYFVPLMLFFPKSVYYLPNLFKAIVVLGIIYLVYDVMFLKTLLDNDADNFTGKILTEYFSKTLAVPCGFLLITYIYHNYKIRIFAFGVLVITLLLGLIRARRGLIFMSACPLLVSYIIFICYNFKRFRAIFLSLILISILSVYGVKVYNKNKEGMFSLITERADVDTRTDVEQCFYEDMKPRDWIIGRGIVGEYYCPGTENDDLLLFRSQIETDYLNIILKGGIIGLALLVLMAVPAIIKGLFFSKNMLSKASAIWIL